jgi:general secretion pathway protein G
MLRASRQAGFTLLEIMLVVMIIAILVGGALVMTGGHLTFAGQTKAKTDIQSISTSLMLYNARGRTYPSTDQGLRALVERPGGEPQPAEWSQGLQDVPLDPWGQAYHYQFPGTHNPDSFDIWSTGPDKLNGTPDDIGNWKQ